MAIENFNHFNNENLNEKEPEIEYDEEKPVYPLYIESLFRKKEYIEDRINELRQIGGNEEEIKKLTNELEEIKRKIETELTDLTENMPIDYNNKDIN